jgi:hypothetical protein
VPTFVAFVELMLKNHAWCHYSGSLPWEYQEDHDLVWFGKRFLVHVGKEMPISRILIAVLNITVVLLD